MKVAADSVVSIEYELRVADGTVVDRSRPGEPLEYLQGHGQIVPGLEREIEGMGQGERKHVVVQPEDAYGPRDPEGLKVVPRSMFPKEARLKVGQMMAAETDAGQMVEFRVDKVTDDAITIDLNHPLAGEVLTFDVHVTGVRGATAEELEHGHSHGEGHHHHHHE